MVCYNNYVSPAEQSTACANSGYSGGNGFSCIINLVIILIVLEFLSNIICSATCF